ncbi:MAG: type IV pilus assembly protein PilM [Patescibacteria group bacterium]
MFNIFGPKSYLGVDIGTTSIKIVEIAKGEPKPRLINYGILESSGHLERINNAIQTSSLKIVDKDVAELLKTIVKKSNFRSNEAVASIPSFSVFITLLEFPKMPKEEMINAMTYQIKQYIPLPVTEVTFDWFIVGERQDNEGFFKEQVLLVSVPNEVINKYKNIFRLAGLNLKALEVESMSLIRSLISGDPTATVLVDIGARSTNIAIAQENSLRFNQQTDFAGTSLTQALSSGLGINIRRAEELKKERGLLGTGDEFDLSTLMVPYLDAIINETKRTKDNYEKKTGAKIERVILAGQGAKLLGIEKYFESQMALPTAIGDPLIGVDYSQESTPLIKELAPGFAVAVGLGIREFNKK